MMVERIVKKAEEQKVSTRLVLKEYIHIVVLDYLFKKGLFSHLVFQGGTALKLLYGGLRYSEDLDFVLKDKNDTIFRKLSPELKFLTSHIKKLIPFIRNIHLKIQKDTTFFKRYHLILEAEFLGTKDRTNIEIVNVPSYVHETIILHHPDIPLSPAIVVEKPEEILSDKLLAFAARNYLKGRDLWDIFFLLNTLKISINKKTLYMLKKKITDYGSDSRRFIADFRNNLVVLKQKGFYILKEEMDKFLPGAYRNMFNARYSDICKEEWTIFSKLLKNFKK